MRSLTAYGNLADAAERISALGGLNHQLTIGSLHGMFHRAAIVLIVPLVLGVTVATASSQASATRKPRRHFISITYDTSVTQPLHLERFPLEDLVGAPVGAAQFKEHDYETRDGSVLIDVLTFTRRGRGAGITIYPLGASVGPTLALRAAYQDFPDISLAFSGPSAPQRYELAGARAYDVGAAIVLTDRSAGWGLGSQAFVGGGLGRIRTRTGDAAKLGDRVFAEGGGGLNSGPFGVELAVKFAWNHLAAPVDHHIITVPVTLRGTLTF